MSEDIYQKAASLVQRLHFVAVATASKEGAPCISPVYFAYDKNLNFYWLSSPDAHHSRNVHENPVVNLVVYDSTKKDGDGFGLFVEARARQLGADEADQLRIAHTVSYERVGKTPRDPMLYTGDYPRRYYVAEPISVWINDEEDRGGVMVDVRRLLSLDEFRRAFSF